MEIELERARHGILLRALLLVLMATLCFVVTTRAIPLPAATPQGTASDTSSGSKTVHQGRIPTVDPARKTDWIAHNGDLRNGRYSSLDQINASNAGRLTVKWMFRPGEILGSNGALVVDGLMYLSNAKTVFAVDAATGDSVWSFDYEGAPGYAHRGPTYGDGVIYAYSSGSAKAPGVVYAIDAKSGEPVRSFGNGGVSDVILAALKRRFPGKYPDTFNTGSLGYGISTPPAYHNGILYVVTKGSDALIPGGLVIAVDAKTAALKWVFCTVPQGPSDEGWTAAKDTWIGSAARGGGGIWTTPAIDPELGMLYVNAGNAAPDFDGSARHGKNLFTNTTLALDLNTGAVRWHFQTIHHDIWDYDTVAGPILFDVTVKNAVVKAVAAASKTGYLYIWDRATGTPINPVNEVPVPTTTDVPGEEPWPTQPIPYTANGSPQEPFVPVLPVLTDPALAALVRPAFSPFLIREFVIIAPSILGGATFGGPSYSPKTRLVYVSGIVGTHTSKPTPVGDTLKPGEQTILSTRLPNKTPLTGTLTAYNPGTGERVWQSALSAPGAAGSLVTGGNVIFQGTGTNYGLTEKPLFQGLDARTGKTLFVLNTGSLVSSDPVTYMVGGKQYVSFVSKDIVITLALP